jgi:hypothetical protein
MGKSARKVNLELLKERARQEKGSQPLTAADVQKALNKSAFESYQYTVRLWKEYVTVLRCLMFYADILQILYRRS